MNYLYIIACFFCLVGVASGQTAYQGGGGSAVVYNTFNSPFNCEMFRGDSTSGTITANYLSGQNCIFFKGSSGSAQAVDVFDNPAACPAFYASLNGASAYNARSYSEDFGACYFIILPIEASPLFAKIVDNEGWLYWSTYAELENAGFEIQKSVDAVHWESIGWINGAGNHQGTLSYEYLDKFLQNRPQYYRTIQFDFDGQATISNVVNLHPSQSNPKQNLLAIYPNPIQRGNQLKIRSWLADDLSGKIKLYTTMGQLILSQKFRFNAFDQLVELPINDLASGQYILVLEDNDGQALNQQKIVVLP